MFKDFLNAGLEAIKLKSQAELVEFGYGQVEPNHLSAQRTGQIYAQLPANPKIEILEQGQFVKYDYAANDNGIGEVNFDGEGEWMLVYNEIKLYRNHYDGSKQWDCEFAMIKDNYQARVYSPYDYEHVEQEYATRYLNGVDADGASSYTLNATVELNRDGKTVTIDGQDYDVDEDLKFTYNKVEYTLEQHYTDDTETVKDGAPRVIVPVEYAFDDVTADVPDIYEINWTNDPYHKLGIYREKRMPKGTSMVPRVFKTNIGDLFTTNTINAAKEDITIGMHLKVGESGILEAGDDEKMTWQVVKIYTMPDGQFGVKVMRIV